MPHSVAPTMVASGAIDEPFWSAAKAHDYFNMGVCTWMSGLTVAAHLQPARNLPLALLMTCYLVADSVWIAVKPEIIGGTEGGGGITLLAHHVMAAVISLHALVWSPHRHYTCWLTVLEVNTLLLMFKKNWPGGALFQKVLDKLFVASWVVTRLIWFPFLAVYLSFIDGYPSLARRVICSAMLSGLTVLQVVWTWNFCVPPEKQFPLP